MYFASIKIAHGVVHQTMPGDGILAGKDFSNNTHLVVAAFPGTGMAGMPCRVILDAQRLRLQDGQLRAQQIDVCLTQAGNAFLNGLTLTC